MGLNADGTSKFDHEDAEILAARAKAFAAMPGPRVGDFVRFQDDVTRRISHLWPEGSVQTSDYGTYYLAESGHLSMSGSLHPAVPLDSLVATGEAMPGDVWFFHHDYPVRDGGVDATLLFRVYSCPRPAPL